MNGLSVRITRDRIMPLSTKAAQSEYQKSWFRRVVKKRRYDWLSEHGPCVDCGSWKELETDHVDPAKKIEHRVWTWSEKRRTEELKKCVVRCHKCHQKKTIRERKWNRHGTESMYHHGPCRCRECREAHAKYRREWRAKTGKR